MKLLFEAGPFVVRNYSVNHSEKSQNNELSVIGFSRSLFYCLIIVVVVLLLKRLSYRLQPKEVLNVNTKVVSCGQMQTTSRPV